MKHLFKKTQIYSLRLFVLILSICFSFSLLAQTNDKNIGFDYETEKEEAKKGGVEKNELEGYLRARKAYLQSQYDYEKNGIGTKNTIPPRQFERKSSTQTCIGEFEDGTIPPWVSYTATNTGIDEILANNVVFFQEEIFGRHSVVFSTVDPIVNSVSTVHSGSRALRLGNDDNDSEIDRVTKSITVDGGCFSFWYALIFENPPNHDPNDRPFFMFRVFDSNGDEIHRYVREAASAQSSSFFTDHTQGVVYRDWTKYELDLSAYDGEVVTLEFTNGDCALSAHYGYSYIDDICFKRCCENCNELFLPSAYTHTFLEYKNSTETECCFGFSSQLDGNLFRCIPYGIKVFEDGDEQNPFVNYFSSMPIVEAIPFEEIGILNFCISKSDFNNQSKTLRFKFYDRDSNVMCDTVLQTIEPCFSSDTECDCDNLFKDPLFKDVPIIDHDTFIEPNKCCFKINPFTSPEELNCPYFGLRVYLDSNAAGHTFLDTLNSNNPMGGPGSVYPDSLNFTFCITSTAPAPGIPNYPFNVRIEYLDSLGKVICSRLEEIDCNESCCEEISFEIIEEEEDCCISIRGNIGACQIRNKAELLRYNGTTWDHIEEQDGNYNFRNVCTVPGPDVNKYKILIKTSEGKIICSQEFEYTCTCCDQDFDVMAQPEPPILPWEDRCCWRVYLNNVNLLGCSIGNWGIYNDSTSVPPTRSPLIPPFEGNLHCTDIITPIYPAPGDTVTVNYTKTIYIAIYGSSGFIICIKPYVLSCMRTYIGGEGIIQGFEVNPNPFLNTFTISMELPSTTAINISVLNSSGVEVYNKAHGVQPLGLFNTNIDLSGVPAGIYTISVNDGQVSGQIIKQ